VNKQKAPRVGDLMTEEQVLGMGYNHALQLPDGRWMAVANMTYGKGRLFFNLDYCGFEACYCYTSVAEAIAAMLAFDPERDEEPQGWFKDPNTNRMRPDGDKSRETIGYSGED
jgi:hypothetical protein